MEYLNWIVMNFLQRHIVRSKFFKSKQYRRHRPRRTGRVIQVIPVRQHPSRRHSEDDSRARTHQRRVVNNNGRNDSTSSTAPIQYVKCNGRHTYFYYSNFFLRRDWGLVSNLIVHYTFYVTLGRHCTSRRLKRLS